jgi:hypothetical protein
MVIIFSLVENYTVRQYGKKGRVVPKDQHLLDQPIMELIITGSTSTYP